MKHNRYRNKDQAYEWCIHIKLFLRPRNTRESPPRVRTRLSILRDRKKFAQKFRGRHRAQEETACFLGKTIVFRVPIMCFRGIYIAARSLVRYGSTGGNGRVWWWGDRAVWRRLGIED